MNKLFNQKIFFDAIFSVEIKCHLFVSEGDTLGITIIILVISLPEPVPYSVYRDLQNRYERAISDVKDLLEFKHQLEGQNNTFKITLTELKTKNSQSEVRIAELETRRRFLEEEGKRLQVEKQGLESRLAKESENLMQTRLDVKTSEKKAIKFQLDYENALEKYELLAKECELLKAQIIEEKRKNEDLQKRFEKLYACDIEKAKQCERIETELITVNQKAKSAELKLEHHKKELATVKAGYEEATIELGSSKSKLEYFSTENVRLSQELKMASEKLSITIKAKNSADSENEELKEQLENLQTSLKQKDESLSTLRIEFEKSKIRIIELQREIELSEANKKVLIKENEVSKTNLGEKLRFLEERIKSELEAKNTWIDRQSTEEKNHSDCKTQLLRSQSELEDSKLKLANLTSDIAQREKTIKELAADRTALHGQIAKLEVEKDNLSLEKEKFEELRKKLEEHFKERINKKKNKRMKLIDFHQIQDERAMCIIEDLSAKLISLQESANSTKSEDTSLIIKTAEQENMIAILQKETCLLREQKGIFEEDLNMQKINLNSVKSELQNLHQSLTEIVELKKEKDNMLLQKEQEIGNFKKELEAFEDTKTLLSTSEKQLAQAGIKKKDFTNQSIQTEEMEEEDKKIIPHLTQSITTSLEPSQSIQPPSLIPSILSPSPEEMEELQKEIFRLQLVNRELNSKIVILNERLASGKSQVTDIIPSSQRVSPPTEDKKEKRIVIDIRPSKETQLFI